MSHKLNLAALNKRQEKIDETDMITVRAGAPACDCEVECVGAGSIFSSVFDADYTGTIYDDCSCGSAWVVFGLAWG